MRQRQTGETEAGETETETGETETGETEAGVLGSMTSCSNIYNTVRCFCVGPLILTVHVTELLVEDDL